MSAQFNRAEFHRRLTQAWYHSGLSIQETADAIDYSRKSIERYMEGSSLPGVQALAGLCRVFGVTADWMLYGEGRKPEWWI